MTARRASKTDYSRIANYYDKVRPPPADILISKIIQHGEIKESSLVLDVGCGTGRFPLCIKASKKAIICSLEPDIAMLNKAVEKDKFKEILWIQGDGQKLPFRGNIFDCVYMTLVIHHVEDKESALQEMRRTLKRDGNCVIMITSHFRMKRAIMHHFPKVMAIDAKRLPTVPGLKDLMVRSGFRNVHYHIVQRDEGFLPTEEYLERVRSKHISTLTLLSEEEFQKGLKIFEEKVRKKYGKQLKRIIGYDFVVGKK